MISPIPKPQAAASSKYQTAVKTKTRPVQVFLFICVLAQETLYIVASSLNA